MPDHLSYADPHERRRPNIAAELRADADRLLGGPSKRMGAPTDAPRDDAPDSDREADRRDAVARGLQRQGVTTARWVKRGDSYRLDVSAAEAQRAVEVMRQWDR